MRRYERERPGELIHLDIQTLGRVARPGKRVLGQGPGRHTNRAGWEAVHVAVDDATRLAVTAERALLKLPYMGAAKSLSLISD